MNCTSTKRPSVAVRRLRYNHIMPETGYSMLKYCVLVILFAAGPTMAAPIGFEEAKSNLEHPKFISGLASCYPDTLRPTSVAVMLDVKPTEAISVSSVSPEPSQQVRGCLEKLVSRLKFLPAGEILTANWNLNFETWTARVDIVDQGAPVSGVRDHSLEYRRAKTMLIVGAGLSGTGFLTAVAGTLYLLIADASKHCDGSVDMCTPTNMTPFWALLGAGGAVLSAGIVLLITGGVRKSSARKWLKSGGFWIFALSPLPDRTGGTLSLTLRF